MSNRDKLPPGAKRTKNKDEKSPQPTAKVKNSGNSIYPTSCITWYSIELIIDRKFYI